MFKRYLYQLAVSLIWIVGFFYDILLLQLFLNHPGVVGPAFAPIIVVGLLVASFYTLYSFWWGAHPGHIVRAVNVLLVSLLGFAMYRDYLGNVDADLLKSSVVWVIALTVVIINVTWGPRLRASYKQDGRVDYFDRYFPN